MLHLLGFSGEVSGESLLHVHDEFLVNGGLESNTYGSQRSVPVRSSLLSSHPGFNLCSKGYPNITCNTLFAIPVL